MRFIVWIHSIKLIMHPKKNAPQPTAYLSASDSDETDNESVNKRLLASKRKAPISRRPRAAKAPEAISASDSDDTDKEQQPAKRAKQEFIQESTPLDAINRANSASDSDETGDEHMIKPEPISTESKALSTPSSSTSRDLAMQKHIFKFSSKPVRVPKTKEYIENSSEEDDDDDDEEEAGEENEADANRISDPATTQNEKSQIASNGKFRESVIKRNHLVGNRLSFRRRGEYDDSKPAAVNLSKRLNDSFLPKVQEDLFVSDSDSEPDSGVDYDTFDFPTWQRTLTWNRKPEEDPWPKQRRFGYSDKLKLEKRIKKICKVSVLFIRFIEPLH